jgi:hypothetical protein
MREQKREVIFNTQWEKYEMSSRAPRKQRNIKEAAAAAIDASVEVPTATEDLVYEQIIRYEQFGFGQTSPSYTQGEVADFGGEGDQQKQVCGRNGNGAVTSLKDSEGIITNTLALGIGTNGSNYYFSATEPGGITGSNVVNFIYDKSGPEAAYIPHLVQNGGGLGATEEYAFFLPASVTGASGANMPPGRADGLSTNSAFDVVIAGAVAKGERINVYTASAAGARVQTGSVYGASASHHVSFDTKPNYSTYTISIPTASLAGTGLGGIVVVYTASYDIDGTSENRPYAGVTVSIVPSNAFSGAAVPAP